MSEAQIEAVLKEWNATHQKLHLGDIREIAALGAAAEAGEQRDSELDDITIRFQLDRIKMLEAELATIRTLNAGAGEPNPVLFLTKQLADKQRELNDKQGATIERCAQVAEWEGYATVGRQIAAAIRALKDEP